MNFSFLKRKSFAVNFLFVTFFCFILNSFLSYEQYTPMADGKWSSTKASLEKGCGSAWAYMFTKTALNQNRLNISIWYGYQELILKRAVEFGSAGFSYFRGHDFFSFLIDKNDSLQYGIVFNANQTDTSFAFIADSEGRFLQKYFFHLSDNESEWNNAVVNRHGDSFTLTINNKTQFSFNMPVPRVVHCGFKGGSFQSMIDDVVIYNPKGEAAASDDFSPPFKLHPVAIVTAIILLLLAGRWTVKRKISPSLWYFYLWVTLGLLVLYAVYFYRLSALFPFTADSAGWFGMKPNIDGEVQVCAKIKNRFPLGTAAMNNKKVIVFIGSSQTWGSGATSDKKTMPSLVEQNLQRYFSDTNIVVINCGIAGLTSDRLYNFYASDWHRYQPVLTVINLSTNDKTDTARFRKSMVKFLDFNRNHHINTLLIPEVNYFVFPDLFANHAIVEKLGSAYGVKVLAMQSYMDSLQETGFLWWDYVHCTDYGYYLMSQRITPAIAQILQESKHD